MNYVQVVDDGESRGESQQQEIINKRLIGPTSCGR